MAQLGKADASIVLCNQCGKRIAIKGIKFQEKRKGEYCVTFFACPHCGKMYQINTTDGCQRELLQQRAKEMEKVTQAIRFGYRKKTITARQKEMADIEKKIKRRAERLAAIGEEILTGSEAKEDGAENGDCGAEGVREH